MSKRSRTTVPVTSKSNVASPAEPLSARFAAIDWNAVSKGLDAQGFATIPGLLAPDDCHCLAASYGRDEQFRSRIVMARHGFGRGEYKYFAYPLPDVVQALRHALYPHLAPLASTWMSRMGRAIRYPESLDAFLAICRDAGQSRPTPLMLKYEAGDYNCLHQDLYGATVFPIQVAIVLSAPGANFEGGEFVLVEQRPRMQSRAAVVPLQQGDAVVFAVNERPVAGAKGDYRVKLRHGVSALRFGQRFTLGIIFHDAA